MNDFKVVEDKDDLFLKAKGSRWHELIKAVKEGKTVMLPKSSNTQSARSGIHAQAARAGFSVDIRVDADGLYIRRRGDTE